MENIICKYSTISERDMDVLFLQALATDSNFLDIFLKKANIISQNIHVLNVELSKTDKDLGESDITVILESDGQKTGLLIEDKIDAAAMPDQHGRYIQRGERGIKNGEYSEFLIFIVCSKKYHAVNDEAKLYENFVSYEECRDYFNRKGDTLSNIWAQQLSQAINKAKKATNVTVNEAANMFLKQYKLYQAKNYPLLDLRTNDKVSGWWVHYRTRSKQAYIYHQTNTGEVKLIFNGKAAFLDTAWHIQRSLHKTGYTNISVKEAGKSASFVIKVPEIDMEKPFETYDEKVLNACFDAISLLTEIANVFFDIKLLMD